MARFWERRKEGKGMGIPSGAEFMGILLLLSISAVGRKKINDEIPAYLFVYLFPMLYWMGYVI